MNCRSKFAFIFAFMILGGCISPQQKARNEQIDAQNKQQNEQLAADKNSKNEQMIAQAEARLERAKKNASMTCAGMLACNKAFSLAKIFVNNNADMKIRYSDDNSAYTHDPMEPGQIGLKITKRPGLGDSSIIELAASCKGISNPEQDPALYELCVKKIENVYLKFMAIF